MGNVFSSAIFCARNVDKAENQNKPGRWGVAVGQAKNVADHVKQLDGKIGKTTKTAIDAMKTFAQEEKVIGYVGKAVDFASKNVNPLICISSAIDVAVADDKEKAAVTNATALATMFTAENLAKKHMSKLVEVQGVDKIAEKVVEFSKTTPHMKTIPSLISGVAFVAASISGYAVGDKAGNAIINTIRKGEKPEEKLEEKTESKQDSKPVEFIA